MLRAILSNKVHIAKHSKRIPYFLVIIEKKQIHLNEKHFPLLPSSICQQIQILHTGLITH